MQMPLKTYIIYARANEEDKHQLLLRLSPLTANGLLSVWHDGDIRPGEDWETAIEKELMASELVIVLVSAHLLNSDFIQTEELRAVLERFPAGPARVVPVVVAPCAWRFTPTIKKFQALPLAGAEGVRPVSEWPNRHIVWASVVEQIGDLAEQIHIQYTAVGHRKQRGERCQQASKISGSAKNRFAKSPRPSSANALLPSAEKPNRWLIYLLSMAVLAFLVCFRTNNQASESSSTQAIVNQKVDSPTALQKGPDFGSRKSGFDMVDVPGGNLKVGNADDDSEKPVHSVTLSTFQIGRYEVTQADWRAIMGSNKQELTFPDCDQCPVEKLSWNDAQDFLQKLNAKYPGKNYRLPTEAEWEYASRGGQMTNHYAYSGSNNIGEVAWYDGNAISKTHPVGGKKANELGLYDMSGNVWEWCSDWYGDYLSSSQTDPKGPSIGTDRVFRGGDWCGNNVGCRPSSRRYFAPTLRSVGFRLARSF